MIEGMIYAGTVLLAVIGAWAVLYFPLVAVYVVLRMAIGLIQEEYRRSRRQEEIARQREADARRYVGEGLR